MMRWFGPSWGAVLNDECEETATPIVLCCYCDAPIEEGDRGVTMPGAGFDPPYTVAGDPPRVAYHIDCLLRSVTRVPSVSRRAE